MFRRLSVIAPLVATLLFSLSQSANSEIVMHISDDGTDLTMTATGSFNFFGMISLAGTDIGSPAVVSPIDNGGTFGWSTGSPSSAYDVAFNGSLTGASNAIAPTSTSTTIPFFIRFDTGKIHFANSQDPSGVVDETATFEGVTLASLGMVSGESVEVFLGGAKGGDQAPIATITTSSVPEPSSVMLFGIAGLVAWRRRR